MTLVRAYSVVAGAGAGASADSIRDRVTNMVTGGRGCRSCSSILLDPHVARKQVVSVWRPNQAAEMLRRLSYVHSWYVIRV